jgi:hypothetical protein
MVGPLRHRQTKETETDMFNLPPPRHISTLPKADLSFGAPELISPSCRRVWRHSQSAVAVSDQGMNLPGEQINPGQETKRAMPLVLMITRKGRLNPCLGGKYAVG